MNQKKITILVIIALVFIFLGIILFLKTKPFKEVIPQNTSESMSPPVVSEEGRKENGAPQTKFIIRKTSKKSIRIEWSNLPEGSKYINLFRSSVALIKWERWKTIEVASSEEAGFREFQLLPSETLSEYIYYEEVENIDEEIVFVSEPNEVKTDTSPPEPTSPPFNAQPLPQTNQPPSNLPPPPTPSPAASTSTDPVSPPADYYTPEGEPITATSSAKQTENFWAIHVNKNIEIGWQNLFEGTDKIVVSRSSTSTSAWSKLFEEQNPDSVGPSYIRLVDNSIDMPHYYKLEAFQNGTLLATYGPVLLGALQE